MLDVGVCSWCSKTILRPQHRCEICELVFCSASHLKKHDADEHDICAEDEKLDYGGGYDRFGE